MLYEFDAGEASAVIQACGRAMLAIDGFVKVIAEQDRALERMRVLVGGAAGGETDEEREAERAGLLAKREARVDQALALRRTLADVVTDAHAARPAEALLGVDVEASINLAPAPLRGVDLTPFEKAALLMRLERWTATETVRWLRELQRGLAALRRLVAAREGEAFENLVRAIDQVLLAL